jgi:hypothetical protein
VYTITPGRAGWEPWRGGMIAATSAIKTIAAMATPIALVERFKVFPSI